MLREYRIQNLTRGSDRHFAKIRTYVSESPRAKGAVDQWPSSMRGVLQDLLASGAPQGPSAVAPPQREAVCVPHLLEGLHEEGLHGGARGAAQGPQGQGVPGEDHFLTQPGMKQTITYSNLV